MTAVQTSGIINYFNIESIVESLIYTEGTRCHIPGMEHEDIAQEIRLECIRVLEFYDPTRIGPSPFIFLKRCIKNKLYNLRRGIYVPNNPPCVRCEFWDRKSRSCKINEMDPEDRSIPCRKIAQYRQNMKKKAELRNPTSLETDIYKQEYETNFFLQDSILDILPEELHKDYYKLIKGKKISLKNKKLIRLLIKEWLTEE